MTFNCLYSDKIICLAKVCLSVFISTYDYDFTIQRYILIIC
jgi:hypothetical protein